MRFTEDKLTRGKKTLSGGRISLYDEESIAFARGERLRKLPKLGDEKIALVVQSATPSPDNKTPSKYQLQLRYDGRTMETPFQSGAAHLDAPEFWNVLCCLLSDIAGIEDETFESWCSNLGMDTDSRQAEKTFNACRDTLPLVRRLLGKDFDEIRALDEDGLIARFKDVKTFKL